MFSWRLKGTCWESAKLSLSCHRSFLSGGPPGRRASPYPSRTPRAISSHRETTGFSPLGWSLKSLSTSVSANTDLTLSAAYIRSYCPVLPEVHHLKTTVLYLSPSATSLSFIGRRVNLFLVNFVLAESRSIKDFKAVVINIFNEDK